ncbi:MAG: GlsB/YeaQ/YmgE family stress response membrane protein [Bdellovibrionaceae bacterium]|nr:GlsB/YeaQ/YmgE family stress response membrane protein [Pseudobdellovibrionaceae bacterium]
MGIIGTIVIGFIIGLIARLIKPGDDKMGFIFTTLVGIAGAFVGAYLGQSLGYYQVGEPAGFIASVFGAIFVLVLLKLAFGRK